MSIKNEPFRCNGYNIIPVSLTEDEYYEIFSNGTRYKLENIFEPFKELELGIYQLEGANSYINICTYENFSGKVMEIPWGDDIHPLVAFWKEYNNRK